MRFDDVDQVLGAGAVCTHQIAVTCRAAKRHDCCAAPARSGSSIMPDAHPMCCSYTFLQAHDAHATRSGLLP